MLLYANFSLFSIQFDSNNISFYYESTTIMPIISINSFHIKTITNVPFRK